MRPLGVTILSLIMLIGGTLFLASGLSLMVSRDVAYPIFVEEYGRLLNQSMGMSRMINISEELVSEIYDTVTYVAIFFGVIYVAVGLGLFMMKEWGRIGTVILAGFNVLYGIFLAFIQPLTAIAVILNLLVIWYLMRPEIREEFTRKISIEERVLGNQNP